MTTTTTETAEMFQVVCRYDGKVRHETLFSTVEEAVEFAEWGHLCTASHGIVELIHSPSKWSERKGIARAKVGIAHEFKAVPSELGHKGRSWTGR